MSITLCMIVKNEKKYIKMCLDNALPLVDNAIIIDTGSTDETIEIIKGFGDKIILKNSTWDNDFSKARNTSLEGADGDWILVIDADEKIIFDKEKLLHLLSTTESQGFRIPIYNIIDNFSIKYSCVYCKLFKNKNYKYIGEIHETISVDPLKISDIDKNICKVIHYGYTAANFQEKDKVNRNLKISINQHKKSPNAATANFNLGNAYFTQGNFDKALNYFTKCYNLSKNVLTANKTVLVHNIGQCLFGQKKYKNCITYLDRLLASYTEDNKTELLFLLGSCYYEIEEYEKALNIFNECIRTGEIRSKVNSLGKGSYLPKLMIARIYSRQNRKNDAAMEYIESLFDRNNFLKNGKEEVIEFLEKNNMNEILDELNFMLKN